MNRSRKLKIVLINIHREVGEEVLGEGDHCRAQPGSEKEKDKSDHQYFRYERQCLILNRCDSLENGYEDTGRKSGSEYWQRYDKGSQDRSLSESYEGIVIHFSASSFVIHITDGDYKIYHRVCQLCTAHSQPV